MRLWVIAIPAAVATSAWAQSTQGATTLSTVWYVSGRVMMEDGAAPPQSVTVENVCNGVTYLTAFTDSRGQFSFRIGASGGRLAQDASARSESGIEMPTPTVGASGSANSAGVQDPSQQSGTAEPQRTGSVSYVSRAANEHAIDACELHARLGGYWTEAISLRNRRPLDAAPLGTIVLHRLGKVDGRTVSVAALAAPKSARSAYEKGRKALTRNKLDEAQGQLEKAVRLYTEYAPAWALLGQVQMKQSRLDDAARSFEHAIQADPRSVPPYLGLAIVQLSRKQWENLIATTSQALKLNPFDFPQAYYLNAVGNYYARRMDAAETSVREAQRLDTSYRWPQSWHVLGLILASRGQYADAAVQFREYLRISPQASDAVEARRSLARAEELSAAATKQ